MNKNPKRIAVSACLLGEKCRFDGKSKPHEKVIAFCQGKDASILAVCPERDGQLPVPRTPSEIQRGNGKDVLAEEARIVSRDGEDRTDAFVAGAKACLERVREFKPDLVILKDGSPSCGTRRIYDGSFNKKTKQGMGVFAALSLREGYRTLCERDL